MHEVEDSKCAEPKPNLPVEQKCNDFSCLAYWDVRFFKP